MHLHTNELALPSRCAYTPAGPGSNARRVCVRVVAASAPAVFFAGPFVNLQTTQHRVTHRSHGGGAQGAQRSPTVKRPNLTMSDSLITSSDRFLWGASPILVILITGASKDACSAQQLKRRMPASQRKSLRTLLRTAQLDRRAVVRTRQWSGMQLAGRGCVSAGPRSPSAVDVSSSADCRPFLRTPTARTGSPS